MTNENRNAARVDRRLRVTIQLINEPGAADEIRGELMDVSQTGVGLRAPVKLPVGTEINVTIHLARQTETGEDRITVPARITGCIPVAEGGHHHIGAALGKLSLHDAQLWHDTIQRWRAFVV